MALETRIVSVISVNKGFGALAATKNLSCDMRGG